MESVRKNRRKMAEEGVWLTELKRLPSQNTTSLILILRIIRLASQVNNRTPGWNAQGHSGKVCLWHIGDEKRNRFKREGRL